MNHSTIPVVKTRIAQSGVFLLEALIAILIFAFGILGIVALGATAIGAQNDAEYRTEAASYANEIVGQIWANVARIPGPEKGFIVDQTSLAAFAHKPTTGTTPCAFSGSDSTNTLVENWVTRVGTITSTNKGLPGASGLQQIIVDTSAGASNQVTVTVCWQGPNDAVPRRHVVVTNVN